MPDKRDAASENASEAAQVLAAIVPYLPKDTRDNLRKRLAHHRAAPTPAMVREKSLGLLVEMVSNGTGEVPTAEQYETLRAERSRHGESWSSYSTLIRAYGHWLAAVRVAMRLHRGDRKVPQNFHHARFRGPYARHEVTAAIRDSRASLGDWPTEWEFYEWASLRRRKARLNGLPEPRLPGPKQVRRIFGSWTRALAVARRSTPPPPPIGT